MASAKQSFQFGSHSVSIETGELARQADGSVLVSMGDTVVLVTAVARKAAQPGKDFFPLTVNYQEKTYAAGRIPGGFFRREGRPSESETLISRLIDRPIRPLFPDGFCNEVQVVATVVSLDPDIPSDIPALLGASAALSLSGVPFGGPIAAARVGYKDGKYLLNPTRKEAEGSQLDLVVAGTAARCADGRIRGRQPARGRDAGRRGVRPRAAAGGHQGDQRAGGRGRQAALGVAGPAGRCGTGCLREGAGRGPAVRGLPHHREAGPLRQGRRDQGSRGRGRARGRWSAEVGRAGRGHADPRPGKPHRARAHPGR